MCDPYFLCAVWKLGFIFDIACSFPFASAYPTNKSSALTKGIVSPLQILLVCYWSVSEHCWQNLFITNSSTFAQNVIHALITLSLDYCRSFFYSHPKSLPSKFQDSWLVSYSGEQSYQLPLPSFSWLTFYGSTRVKIALWISERFMVLLQLIIAAWSSLILLCPPYIPLLYVMYFYQNFTAICLDPYPGWDWSCSQVSGDSIPRHLPVWRCFRGRPRG